MHFTPNIQSAFLFYFCVRLKIRTQVLVDLLVRLICGKPDPHSSKVCLVGLVGIHMISSQNGTCTRFVRDIENILG